MLDRATGTLRQLGGPDAAPSSLMFAKFSPDGQGVAYVRDHDLWVESSDRWAAPSRHDRWIGDDHQRDVGLGVRGRAQGARLLPMVPRWYTHRVSPIRHQRRPRLSADRRHDRPLFVKPVQYPKAGRRTPPCALGSCRLTAGPLSGSTSGDLRNNYIPETTGRSRRQKSCCSGRLTPGHRSCQRSAMLRRVRHIRS